MKFGLYVVAGTSGVFRCVDGEWTHFANITQFYNTTPEKGWETLSALPGAPVDAKSVASRTHFYPLITTRNMARLIYGVPDEVDLYAPGERPGLDGRSAPRETNDSPIAKARLAHGMTQGQLAALVGVKLQQISLWENGLRKPKLDALKRLGEALDVDWTTLTT